MRTLDHAHQKLARHVLTVLVSFIVWYPTENIVSSSPLNPPAISNHPAPSNTRLIMSYITLLTIQCTMVELAPLGIQEVSSSRLTIFQQTTSQTMGELTQGTRSNMAVTFEAQRPFSEFRPPPPSWGTGSGKDATSEAPQRA